MSARLSTVPLSEAPLPIVKSRPCPRLLLPLAASVLVLLPASPEAQEASPEFDPDDAEPTLFSALKGGETWVDLRYRFEFAGDGARPDQSYASTLRTVVGYETASWKGLTGLVEFEDVSGVGPEEYNDGLGGMPERAAVPDPEGTSINRAYLNWSVCEETDVRVGRQYLQLDNQRWVGIRPWRQRHATFEAVGVSSGAIGPLDVYYGYVSLLNTPARTNVDSRSHLLNVSGAVPGWGRLTGYGYYIDLPDDDALSCLTVGARFSGEQPVGGDVDLLYQAEVARQVDAGDNPNDRDAPYYLLDLAARRRGVRYHVGFEILGGDGNPGGAVQVPFGKRYFFNGWANVFVTTPDTGLEDVYAKVVAPWRELNLELALHDFRSDAGGTRYGGEVDAVARWQAREDLEIVLGLAHYAADELAEDLTRAWLSVRLTL